jgi:hypothetical protein
MKIGIQILAYNCEETIEKIIKPWIELKNKYDIKIWVGSGQFKTYAEMGCENLNGPTEALLLKLVEKGDIDFLYTPPIDNLLTDPQTRDKCVPWMIEKDIDLMVQVDADEFYSLREAGNLLKFVEHNQDYTCYNTVFKNVIGDGKIEDWERFSAGWIKKHGGIKEYYWDMHWWFNEELDYRSTPTKTIPKELVNPYHYTWTNDMNTTGPSHIKEKIEYQNRIYGNGKGFDWGSLNGCGFEWDSKTNKIKKK